MILGQIVKRVTWNFSVQDDRVSIKIIFGPPQWLCNKSKYTYSASALNIVLHSHIVLVLLCNLINEFCFAIDFSTTAHNPCSTSPSVVLLIYDLIFDLIRTDCMSSEACMVSGTCSWMGL